MHIHILGIAGVMTAQIAMILKQQGHEVTGSDQDKIYPPISQLIADIPLNKTPINTHIDAVIVGSSFLSFSKCVEEWEQIKKLNIPYTTATEFIAKSLIRGNSILVAGSYGKSTITALVSWIMDKSGYHPNYFFGGQLVNHSPSINSTTSNWSVVEADESINGLDTKAKFLYYPVKYLILTSAQWEHKESYSTSEKNFEAFRQLIKNVPENGFIVYNGQDSEIKKIISESKAPTFDYQIDKVFKSKLIGQYNQQNIAAAYTFCHQLGLKSTIILKYIATFPGLKRRLEKISSKNNILIYDDFAQSGSRVYSALTALQQAYPKRRIFVYFEPHAKFLQNQKSLNDFSQIKNMCHEFILSKIHFSANTGKNDRVTAANWQKVLGEKMKYLPIEDDIFTYLSANLKPGDLLIHFSSGGLDGLNNLKQFII